MLTAYAVRQVNRKLFFAAQPLASAEQQELLSIIAGFCKYAVEEELLDYSRPLTSGGLAWTMNLTPPLGTATSSGRSWSLPGSGRRSSMR